MVEMPQTLAPTPVDRPVVTYRQVTEVDGAELQLTVFRVPGVVPVEYRAAVELDEGTGETVLAAAGVEHLQALRVALTGVLVTDHDAGGGLVWWDEDEDEPWEVTVELARDAWVTLAPYTTTVQDGEESLEVLDGIEVTLTDPATDAAATVDLGLDEARRLHLALTAVVARLAAAGTR